VPHVRGSCEPVPEVIPIGKRPNRSIRQARASIISEVVGECARPPLAGAIKGITIDLSTND
jgi:hypothetical protein